MFTRSIAKAPTRAAATRYRKAPLSEKGPSKRTAPGPIRSLAWDLSRISVHSLDHVNVAPTHGGRPLDPEIRKSFEPRFGRDFSAVRVHSDARAGASAEQVDALALTVGQDIVFGVGQYVPGSTAGRELIAHELAHVVQQSGGSAARSAGQAGNASLESEADRAASAVMNRVALPRLSGVPIGLQRRVSIRDVGRGEQSGLARAGELVDRLNRMSSGLTYGITGGFLTYTRKTSGALSEFDSQMTGYIDNAADIPMRLTNRHGLMGDRATGFNTPVAVDSWLTGYVDIDDMLASSDLGLQTSLVHLLRERQQTHAYAQRLGSPTLDASRPGPAREFAQAHASGINAELQVLRDFFSDPSIHIVDANSRLFRNERNDVIRERETAGRGAAEQGNLAISWVVVLHDTHRVISAEGYKDILDTERRRREAERARGVGAAEHHEGGRSVPPP
jgi:Domain of unknown function (DUF4157)